MANTYTFVIGTLLAILAASGTDSKISSYAIDSAPVYGSAKNAQRASDALALMSAGTAALIYTVKYFPYHDRPADFPLRQVHAATGGYPAYIHLPPADAFGAGALSGLVTLPTADLMKKFTERPRPSGEDNYSFPSGHAMFSTWTNAYSAHIVNSMRLPSYYHYPAHGALALMTAGTAWGRVEGAKHYPSDVLAAMFMGVCLTDAAFLFFQDDAGQGHEGGPKFNISFTNERDVTTTALTFTVSFLKPFGL